MKFDLSSVLRATARNQAHMEMIEECVADPRQAQRLEVSECRACFYMRGRQGGARRTKADCKGCGKEMWFGNTCTDDLCQECAVSYKVCRRCGADLADKTRRKLERK